MAKCSKAIEVYIALYNFILKEEGDLDDFEDDNTIQPPTLHVASDKTATCDKIMEKYYKDWNGLKIFFHIHSPEYFLK